MTLAVYKLSSTFPGSEQFGLTNQMRRASVSAASNIAEGYGKSSKGEYLLFLGHTRGSNCELQTQLVIAEGLGFGSNQLRGKASDLSSEVSKMLGAMITKLKTLACGVLSVPCSLFPVLIPNP